MTFVEQLRQIIKIYNKVGERPKKPTNQDQVVTYLFEPWIGRSVLVRSNCGLRAYRSAGRWYYYGGSCEDDSFLPPELAEYIEGLYRDSLNQDKSIITSEVKQLT